MKHLAVALLAVALAGCATPSNDRTLHRLTAGAIGCPQAEIVISNHERMTWQADCRGRTFYCSFLESAQCREAVARPQ